jgi:hypothetical protein
MVDKELVLRLTAFKHLRNQRPIRFLKALCFCTFNCGEEEVVVGLTDAVFPGAVVVLAGM